VSKLTITLEYDSDFFSESPEGRALLELAPRYAHLQISGSDGLTIVDDWLRRDGTHPDSPRDFIRRHLALVNDGIGVAAATQGSDSDAKVDTAEAGE
jgi:hypothetical protein